LTHGSRRKDRVQAVNVPGLRLGMLERVRGLWDYRYLIGNLVARDLKVRYKESLLGFGWSMASPLLAMLVFYLLFGILLQTPSNPPQYHGFILVGVLAWGWFSQAINTGTGCIVNNGSLIKKVYFPREVLPVAVVLSECINFMLALPVLMAILWIGGRPPSLHVGFLPLIILAQALYVLGLVLILSTLNVFYRDVKVVMGVVLLGWFFLTPVFYDYQRFRDLMVEIGPFSLSAESLAYSLNPVASLITSFRSVLYGNVEGLGSEAVMATPPSPPDLSALAGLFLTSFITLAFGWWVFGRQSHRFGEEI